MAFFINRLRRDRQQMPSTVDVVEVLQGVHLVLQHVHVRLQSIESIQANIERKLHMLDPVVQKMVDDIAANANLAQAALDALKAESAQIATLTQQVADLQSQLASGTPISAENLTALQGALAQLDETNTKLQPAVPANTPAAAPAPAPAADPSAAPAPAPAADPSAAPASGG